MKQKYCPYCDQKMKISHYCQECRRIVWQPYEQNVDYYLNERHPQSEKNCLYHDNTKQPEKMGKTKPNVPKPLSVFMIVIGLCVACNILGGIFMVGRSAFYGISDMLSELNRPDETVSSYQELTDEEVKAVVDVAHRAGKKCFAHLSNDKAIRQSVLLGVDSVEHGYTLSEETAKLMAEHGTYFVPTISVSSSDDYLLAHGCPAHQVEKGREAAKTHRQGVTWAHKHGVKICVGTDLLPSDPVDGTNATVREIELLVQCGLSPMEAIKAATSTGAELCGLQDVTGTLKPGLMGDFIVVEGKPDENISDLRKLRLVAKHCRLIWSTLPNLNVRRFSVLAPGYEMKGGTFCDWRLI